MPHVLIVAEKPAVAKGIIEVLARGSHAKVFPRPWCCPPHSLQRAGRSQYNFNFDFSLAIEGQQCTVTLTSVLGHVMNYDFPPPIDKQWCVVAAFVAPASPFRCPPKAPQNRLAAHPPFQAVGAARHII